MNHSFQMAFKYITSNAFLGMTIDACFRSVHDVFA